MQPSISLSSLLCDEDIADVGCDDGGAATLTNSAAAAVDFNRSISALLATEVDHLPAVGYPDRFRDGGPLDPISRLQAVDWIFRVNASRGFHPSTAYVAVNYFDRFLSLQPHLPFSGADTLRLLAAACISVAAKMWETTAAAAAAASCGIGWDYGFEYDVSMLSKMEHHLLHVLEWQLRPVTPFDFVDHVVGFPSSSVSDFILATRRVVELTSQRPSAIAVAAILLDGATLTRDKISQEEVEKCHRLVGVHKTDTRRSKRRRLVKKPAVAVGSRQAPPLLDKEITAQSRKRSRNSN
ncbi:cyclin-D4-1-like [Wolffia australiana]